MEEMFIDLLNEYGYFILFIWALVEGELGLVMAGILCHTGQMAILPAILVASAGGFVGDQIYFYIGRFNKRIIHKLLHKQRTKFALAHLLLKRYGWPLIFAQRYLYGLRTIIPMAIGLTRYSSKNFALINYFSALAWASVTILLAYLFGEELLTLVRWGKEHFYLAFVFAGGAGSMLYIYLHRVANRSAERNMKRRRAAAIFNGDALPVSPVVPDSVNNPGSHK